MFRCIIGNTYLFMINFLVVTGARVQGTRPPNLSIYRSTFQDAYVCTLHNDSTTTVTWDTNDGTAYGPGSTFNCKIDQDTLCTSSLLEYHYVSNFTDFPPVLNELWQDFTITRLTSKYVSVKKINTNLDEFHLSLSIQSDEVAISFCNPSHCNVNVTLDPRGVKEYSAHKGWRIVRAPRLQANETGLLNSKRWHHFHLKKEDTTYTFRSHNQHTSLFSFTKPNSHQSPDAIYIRGAKNQRGSLKIHQLNALAYNVSTKAHFDLEIFRRGCYLMFVKLCEGCVADFEVHTKPKTQIYRTKSKQIDGWQRIALQIDSNRRGSIDVSVRIINDTLAAHNLWYISDTIRSCFAGPDTMAVLSYKAGCCYALKYPQYELCTDSLNHYNPGDWQCSDNTLGKNCLPCDSTYYDADCKSSICDITIDGTRCSCTNGYQGSNCTQACVADRFGFDCRKKCGKCSDPCDHISGFCNWRNCQHNFKGSKCDIPELPIARHAPRIEEVGYRNASVLFPLQYEGERAAVQYYLQFKEKGDLSWTNITNLTPHHDSTIKRIIGDLKVETEYQVRTILVARNYTQYVGDHVLASTFKTLCKDLHPDDIVAYATNTTLEIHFQDDPLRCSLHQHDIFLYGPLFNRSAPLQRTSLKFKNLLPYTWYTLEITNYKLRRIIFSHGYRTQSGPPGPVENLKIQQTDTNATISWLPPSKSNSIVNNYKVEYKLVKHLECQVEANQSTVDVVITRKRNITINDLDPHSSYYIRITAGTESYGESSQVMFNTNASPIINKDELPTPIFEEFDDKLTVTLKWRCEKLKSPVIAFTSMQLICASAWCHGSKSKEPSSSFNSSAQAHVYSVLPYTNYALELQIFRQNRSIYSENTTYVTAGRDPGKIRNLEAYSMNATSISFRWLPPYPPTGPTDEYHVQVLGDNSPNKMYSRRLTNSGLSCKLWKEYLCHTEHNLTANLPNLIQVKAVNSMGEGPYLRTISTTKERAPQPPQNVTSTWDKEHRLTVHWLHPNKTNGRLIKFIIRLDGKRLSPYVIDQEKPMYKYEIDAANLTARKLVIEVAAQNSVDLRYAEKIFVIAPPKTPEFLMPPRITQKTETFLKLYLPNVTNVEGDKSEMEIILCDKDQDYNEVLHDLQGDVLNRFRLIWKYDLAEFSETEIVFIEEDENVRNFLKRDSLTLGVVLKNTYANITTSKYYSVQNSDDSSSYIYVFLLIPLVLCAICVVIIRCCYGKISTFLRNTRHSNSEETSAETLGNAIALSSSDTALLVRRNSRPRMLSFQSKRIVDKMNEIQRKHTKTVKIVELDQYLKKAIDTGKLDRQFEQIPTGQVKPWNDGTAPENKLKNMFPDVAAYDPTRVKLEIINGDPFSDYINANYINGYNSEKMYIAAQGPKESTLNDFWRMIWQEKVIYIVVVSQVIEKGSRKFEKYWPEINGFIRFGGFLVTFTDVEVFANYTIRYFDLEHDGQKRYIHQLHFQYTPNANVSLYVRNFSSFSKKVLSLPLRNSSPILVHGSNGFGRTGVLILCDICLRMALAEGRIDVYYHLDKLRQQRINMVSTVEHYKIAHFVLLQILQCLSAPSETGIICDKSMEGVINDAIANKMERQLRFLDDSAWQDQAMRAIELSSNYAIVAPQKKVKRPTSQDDILQGSHYPCTSEDESQIYIRAEVVDSFLTPSKFITTENPTIPKIGVFWQMIVEKQIGMLVSLNTLDINGCQFYPTSNAFSIHPAPDLEIKFCSKESSAFYDIYNISIINGVNQEKTIPIILIQLKKWDQYLLCPDKPNNLLAVYEAMTRLGKQSSTISITCHDGIRACGLYTALCFLIEKIKSDHVCDVCLAVQTIRQARREFVRPPEQFKFLYSCGYTYVCQFETYANFNLSNP